MKRVLTIGFVLLLLSLQYARHLSYLGCTLVTPNNATCNCESILVEKEEDHSYAPPTHKHIKVEDFVQQKQLPIIQQQFLTITNKPINFYNNKYTYLYCRSLLKPPIA